MLTRVISVVGGMAILVGGNYPLAQSVDPNCENVLLPDGTFELVCDEPGAGGDGGGDGDDGGGSGAQGCRFEGKKIPCTTEFGYWDGVTSYMRVADPQPPKDSSYWEGNVDGVIIESTPYECAIHGTNCDSASLSWAPEPPAGPQVSAEELAHRAVAQMNLDMGDIGSTPPSTAVSPDALGQVGLPIWLWVVNRQENTVGPIERTASDGGLSVTARGELDRTEWTISRNGQALATVTCRGADAPGTPYDGRESTLPSPTCGFPADFNAHLGNLTLTGTAHWVVTWSGGNQSGTISVPPQSTETQIRIGETQAILD